MSAKPKLDAALALVELPGKLDAVLAGQAEILRLLRLAVECGGKRHAVDARTAELLRAIAAAYPGDCLYTSAELVGRAALLDPEAVELRAAIVALVGALNARKLGKLLRRLDGVDLDGLAVHRMGPYRDGVLWKVVREFREFDG